MIAVLNVTDTEATDAAEMIAAEYGVEGAEWNWAAIQNVLKRHGHTDTGTMTEFLAELVEAFGIRDLYPAGAVLMVLGY